MREITKQRSTDQRILAYGIAIFVCVFLGPFGTDVDLDFAGRIVFWTVAVIVVGTVMEASFVAALESRWLTRTHISVQLVIGAAVGAVPGTALIIFVNTVLRPEHLSETSFLSLWLKVAIMGLLVAGLECLIWYRLSITSRRAGGLLDAVANQASQSEHSLPEDQGGEEPAEAETFEISRLARRLPDKLRQGQIISLSMQDHYVEVTTTLGSAMLLMRLSDAIDLLDGLAGAQTHRSHWTAATHAVKLRRKGRKSELTLSDGRTLPVSLSYKANVEAMLTEKGQA